MNLTTDEWYPRSRRLTVKVQPLPHSVVQFDPVTIEVNGGKDMTSGEIRDVALAGGIEAEYLSLLPGCRKTGSLLVTATACTERWRSCSFERTSLVPDGRPGHKLPVHRAHPLARHEPTTYQ